MIVSVAYAQCDHTSPFCGVFVLETGCPETLRREKNPRSPGSGPHRVAGPDQYLNHLSVPCGVVGFDQVIDMLFKEPGQ